MMDRSRGRNTVLSNRIFLTTIAIATISASGIEANAEETMAEPEQRNNMPHRQERVFSKQYVHALLENVGKQTFEEFAEEKYLPRFEQNRRGRRKLNHSKKETSSEDDLYSRYGNDYYGIGRVQSRYGSPKGQGKGKGKGGVPKPAPRPPPKPAPQPPPKPAPRPTMRPTQPTFPPIPNPKIPTEPPPSPAPSRPPSSGCQIEINVDFLQFSAIPPAIFINPNIPNEQDLGTRYIYNDGLRDQDTLDELQGSKASGTCSRTQSRFGSNETGLSLGGGSCLFTYTLFDGNNELVFVAAGDVVDVLGGTLSITGGSKSAVGAFGEIDLIPVNLLPDGSFEVEEGDFFLGPVFYLADATIMIPCANS